MQLSKKILLLVYTVISSISVSCFGQEGVDPIIYNIELMDQPFGVVKTNKSATFDSTILYFTDTLSLPFFDDFCKNKIQKYDGSVSDPGIESELYFSLLDSVGTAFPLGTMFTRSQTFKRVYDANLGTTTIINFSPREIQYSNLATYPPQYENILVYPPYYIYDTIGIPNIPDTIFIPGADLVQTTATQFFLNIQEPDALWLDDEAYHNYRFGVDPWSLGVMTFDGTDSKGYPYAIGTTITGNADHLTSKPIDLSGFSPADSLYISFLYQMEGFGDVPEDIDSLILQFRDVGAGQWRRIWAAGGGVGLTSFKMAHIAIKNDIYFTDAFQFRFVNRARLSGALDHINLDYVNLRAFSGMQDTLIEDFAMVYPTKSLLEKYSSVPWDHYKSSPNGKMNTDWQVVVRNSYLNGGANITSANGAKVMIYHDNNLDGQFSINGQALVNYNPPMQPVPDYAPRTTYTSYHDITGYQFPTNLTGNYQDFKVVTVANVPVGSNYPPNDTSYVYQTFRNYYAYDDGSAEKAYGPEGSQARLAIQYDPYVADTIIGVDICFVPTVINVTNFLFQVTIWDDNNGRPGAVIYEDNGFNLRQPSYGYGRNGFTTYWTEYPVPVTGKFYVGWKQLDANRLGVGLDCNTDRKEYTYYSVDFGSTWFQSEIPGSVMVRPIFSTLMNDEMSVPQVDKKTFEVYPNPTTKTVTIKGEFTGNEIFVLRDITGRELMRTHSLTLDLDKEPAGLYFIEVLGAFANTIKVIKR